MKKIIILCIGIISLFIGMTGVKAFYTISEMRKEQDLYGKLKQREVYSINSNSKIGDYVVKDIYFLKTYYTSGDKNSLPELVRHAIINFYDYNQYEQRQLVTKKSFMGNVLENVLVAAKYIDVPITTQVVTYGDPFEIPYTKCMSYILKGYKVYDKVVYEYKTVKKGSKKVKEKVAVTKIYAQKKYTKTVITGYKKVIDTPAYYALKTVKKLFPPETVTYNKLILTGNTGMGGFVEGLRKGAEGSVKFFGEVCNAILNGDASQITFIREGRKYLASILSKANSAGEFYQFIIRDAANNVVSTFNFAVDYYGKNPDEIFELMGTLTFTYASGKLVDTGLSKLDINITPGLTKVFNKNKTIMSKLLANYGDDVMKYADKFGDDGLNAIARVDKKVVESVVDNLDDYANANDLAKTLDSVKDVTGDIKPATFKSSYEIPKDPVTGLTKSYPQLGTKVHKEYKFGADDGINTFKEKVLDNGRKVDFLDVKNGIVYELKPNNPKAIKAGEKQAREYIEELNRMSKYKPKFAIGKEWKIVIDTY